MRKTKKLIILVLALLILSISSVTLAVEAAEGDVLDSIDLFIKYLFAFVTGIGIIFCIIAGIQIALSYMQHDPSQRMTAVMVLGGGLFAIFLKSLLKAISVPVVNNNHISLFMLTQIMPKNIINPNMNCFPLLSEDLLGVLGIRYLLGKPDGI